MILDSSMGGDLLGLLSASFDFASSAAESGSTLIPRIFCITFSYNTTENNTMPQLTEAPQPTFSGA